jgi:DNA repair protein RadD
MALRQYQQRLIDDVREAYATGYRSVLMQLGTGGGKTFTAATLIRLSVEKGNRVIFAAHLESLITDTSARLTEAGVAHGIVQADRPTNPTASVQVASLQTLHRRPECRPPADLIIIDECRRAAAPTVRAILDAYPRARLLGLDATPERADGTALRDLFESMVYGPSILELTKQGHLVPAHVLSPPQPTEGTLAMDPAEAYATYATNRQAIIFCRDVEHARDVASRMPVATAVVTGDTPRAQRETVRERIASGELRAIANVDVYRDGADLPALDCVIVARTMGHASAWLQACGRGLRSHPGKTNCLVIDLVGAAILHGLPADERIWSLDGESRRAGPALVQLARCNQCFAVFHVGPPTCPRCGASAYGSKVKRRATRIERQELSRLDTRPQHVRDRIALEGIAKRLRNSGRFSEAQIPHIAASIFAKKNKRRPEVSQ